MVWYGALNDKGLLGCLVAFMVWWDADCVCGLLRAALVLMLPLFLDELRVTFWRFVEVAADCLDLIVVYFRFTGCVDVGCLGMWWTQLILTTALWLFDGRTELFWLAWKVYIVWFRLGLGSFFVITGTLWYALKVYPAKGLLVMVVLIKFIVTYI